MAPPGSLHSLEHRIRRAHPLRPAMRHSLAGWERASAAEIAQRQERRLRWLVRLAAARSPFYREWFGRSGVDPRSIRTLHDLRLLPLLQRSDLVERPEDFRVYPRRLMWAAHSSGTSGMAITTYRTPGSSAFELSILERQWSWFGVPAGSRRVILRGSDFAADQTGVPVKLVPGGRQLLVSSFHLTPQSVPAILDAIRTFRPHAVEGWPSSIALLAALLRDRGEAVSVRAVITSSEVMSPGQRKLMSEVFAAPVIDHYGQTERVMMAGECNEGGFHVFPDYGITELLPVEGTQPKWEIVGTPLHNWGFPLFRYRTGDHVGPAANGSCTCGRAFDLIGPVDGRIEDAFTAADGRPLPLPATVIDDLAGAREVQIAQLAPGRFEIRIVPGARYDADATEARARRNLDRLFGPGQELTIRTLTAIPRPPSGKLKPAVVEGPPRRSARG
ncbi:phenylacetate--CoA ligase family protein [Rhodococcus opacus]|uniref:phenylacetate--CoA ligase family protein n=1 Tax=Rhodococcus opacus TaxID=37919 RepID=UPI001B307A8E